MKKTIGQRISEARRALSLTQEGLAEAIGVSAQAVSKWENDISCPDISLLPALAKLLGTTTDELLTGEGDSPKAELLPPEERGDFEKKVLRIKVLSGGGDKIKINMPMPLMKVLIDSGVSINSIGGDKMKGLDIDWNSIMKMIEHGVIGKLVEVESADGDTVEIVVE